ncbi:MAG: hypothetical protein KAT05_11590 [Spirochaetes bacterium]|nr:hypothetical protein [Spirochaetota bacterium]MCK5604843.1 hypothetical protein [Candidatus Pacearchaeota archaeon]
MSIDEKLQQLHGTANIIDLMNKLGVEYKRNKYIVSSRSFSTFEEALNFAHENFNSPNVEQEEINQLRDQKTNHRKNTRLGLNIKSPNIDSGLIPLFAKVSRAMGGVITVIFVWWGTCFNWSYSRSPFEAFIRTLEVSCITDEFAVLLLVGFVLLGGWFYRFTIGSLLAVLIFWMFDVVKKMLKAV